MCEFITAGITTVSSLGMFSAGVLVTLWVIKALSD